MPIVLVLPGLPPLVPAARIAVRNLLHTTATPIAADAELVTAELVTNAIRHGAYRDVLTLTLTLPLSLNDTVAPIRIEVAYAGPIITPDPAEAEEYAYALTLVRALSTSWGHARSQDCTVWWAELAHPAPASPPTAVPSPTNPKA